MKDIERLREHLKIENWHVFGGSWVRWFPLLRRSHTTPPAYSRRLTFRIPLHRARRSLLLMRKYVTLNVHSLQNDFVSYSRAFFLPPFQNKTKVSSRPRQVFGPTVCCPTGPVTFPVTLLLTDAISQWHIHLQKDVSPRNPLKPSHLAHVLRRARALIPIFQ